MGRGRITLWPLVRVCLLKRKPETGRKCRPVTPQAIYEHNKSPSQDVVVQSETPAFMGMQLETLACTGIKTRDGHTSRAKLAYKSKGQALLQQRAKLAFSRLCSSNCDEWGSKHRDRSFYRTPLLHLFCSPRERAFYNAFVTSYLQSQACAPPTAMGGKSMHRKRAF
eukprot:1139516-Pelagomonas_calceolata.AAC.1